MWTWSYKKVRGNITLHAKYSDFLWALWTWRRLEGVIFLYSRSTHEWGSIRERRLLKTMHFFLLLYKFIYLVHVSYYLPLNNLTKSCRILSNTFPALIFVKVKTKCQLIAKWVWINTVMSVLLIGALCNMLDLIESVEHPDNLVKHV